MLRIVWIMLRVSGWGGVKRIMLTGSGWGREDHDEDREAHADKIWVGVERIMLRGYEWGWSREERIWVGGVERTMLRGSVLDLSAGWGGVVKMVLREFRWDFSSEDHAEWVWVGVE